MLIKIFTSIFDGRDVLNPPRDETDFTVNLCRRQRTPTTSGSSLWAFDDFLEGKK